MNTMFRNAFAALVVATAGFAVSAPAAHAADVEFLLNGPSSRVIELDGNGRGGHYKIGERGGYYQPGQSGGDYKLGKRGGYYTPGQPQGHYKFGKRGGYYQPGQSGSQSGGYYKLGKRGGYYKPAQRDVCNPNRALRKARKMGIHRVDIVRVNDRRIIVAGIQHHRPMRVAFANQRHCPVIRVRR